MSMRPKATCCISSQEALELLKEGNKQYQISGPNFEKLTPEQRYKLSSGQCPIAVILSCSDSRVPPELIFNQQHGNLFVIRIAGNTLNKTILASIEFALIKFNIPLIIVMGHSKCGAVIQTLEEPENPHTREVTDLIKPALANFKPEQLELNSKNLEQAIKANIKYVVDKAQTASTLIKQYIKNNKIKIVGAFYKIKTGKVDFI